MIRRIAGMLWLVWIAGTAVATAQTPSVEQILTGLEARYAPAGLSARFTQTSTLQAMEITDSAEGRLWIRRPGKMRWEYTAPEPQTIVSDGTRLWVYRPEDRQVMVGGAPAYFGDGKGAGFLADIGQLRRQFDIFPIPQKTDSVYGLSLVPRRQQPDLVRIELEITAADFTIRTVTTFNAYGDKTRIVIHDPVFHDSLDDALFVFDIPPGVEIMQMEP